MAIQKVIQTSFTGGELSPRMLARVDLGTYQRSAKQMINGYPYTHGGVTRRPGTQFIGEVSDSTKPVRLIPFTFSKTQSFALVFNDGKIEFLKNKAFITTGSPALPYSISHPFTDAELFEVTYAQSGSLMFLAHPNHAPKQLQRVSDTNWTLTDLDFTYNAVTDQFFENAYIEFTIVATGDGHDVGDFYEITVDALGGFTVGGPFNGSGGDAPVGSIVGVAVNQDNIAEQTWTITCVVKSSTREEWEVVGSGSPGLGEPPAQWSDNDYPRAVSFHEQRLWFGGSNTRPQTIWGSAAGDFSNFTRGPLANDGLQFQIASNRFDQIIHLESARQLLIQTFGGEFSLTGGGGGITPSSFSIRRNTMHGTNDVRPMRVGQEILFVQRDGKKIRAISFDVTLDSNVAPEISILSEHITREDDADGIVDMTFAQDPEYIAWLVRDDGVLLSLTHIRDQEVTAFAKHTTGASGKFKAVTAIPEGTTDTVYVCVEREIDDSGSPFGSPFGSPPTNPQRYIEFFEEDSYLDSHLDVTLAGSPLPTTVTGLDHLEGQTVSIVADGSVHPDRTVVGGEVELAYGATNVTVGLGYTTTIQLLHPSVPLGDGTAQGRQLTIKQAVARLNETIGLQINGEDVPVVQLPVDALGDPPVPFTGDKQIYVSGWTSPNELLIEQVLPMPFQLLGVILKVEVNE